MSTALVGGQFGSEGKGLIASVIGREYNYHVRVGAANAGHTFYDIDGFKRVLQQIPCGAFTNPHAELFIGPGALISPDILRHEVEAWQAWRDLSGWPRKPLWVDARAHVITPEQVDREAQSGLDKRIGSTSTIAREGVGQAQADRVMRSEFCVRAAEWRLNSTDPWMAPIQLCDVPAKIAEQNVLLEGTQGASLSLTTGHHPYITSRNTTSAGLCADAGVAPTAIDRVIMVCRTFPIRVAGPSGPFWFDSVETDWETLGVDPETQRTSVTKKIRRVATFSMEQVREGVILNGATEIALTFGDYLSPRLRGITDRDELDTDADGALIDLVHGIELDTGIPVSMIGTGPDTVIKMGD